MKGTLFKAIAASLICLVLATGVRAGEEPERITLAVMYFTNRGGAEEWDWLRKGLADLLITDLASSDRLLLVERERMQAVLKELKVSEAGAIDKAVAIKAARIAQVDAALFGSYQVTGDEIEIEAHIVDLETASVRRVEWVKGKASEVHEVEKRLAGQIIANLDVKLTELERERLKRLQTDSVDAMARFYRGLDRYDRGDYPHAFAGFRAATSKDRAYVRAWLWVAKIYIAMDEVEHGLLAYQEALKDFPDDPLTPQLRFDYAVALQHKAQDYEGAIRQYTKIIESHPLARKSYDEWLRARIDEKTGPSAGRHGRNQQREMSTAFIRRVLFQRAYCHYELGKVEHAFDDMYGAYALGAGIGHDIYGLSRRASECVAAWYYELAMNPDKETVAPAWVYRFKSVDDSYVVSPSSDPRLGNPLSIEMWHGTLIEAPQGYLFDKITAEVEIVPSEGQGYASLFVSDWHGKEGRKGHHFIRNFDPKELTYTWKADCIPDTKLLLVSDYRAERFKRIEIRGSFKKQNGQEPEDIQPKFTHISLVTRPEWAESWVNGWKTIQGYAKVYPGAARVKVSAPGYPTKEFDLNVPPQGVSLFVSLEDDWKPVVEIAKGLSDPSMILDHDGLYRLVAVGGGDGASDLCQMVSRDALNWQEPVKLSVNSGQDDYCPRLIQAEDGMLVLGWLSTREKKDKPVACVSTSASGRQWSDPVIVRPPDDSKKRGTFVFYSLWQDADGIFWLQTSYGVLRSQDAKSWKWVPPSAGGTRAVSWRLPTMKRDGDKPVLEYRKDRNKETVLRGRMALEAIRLRQGTTLSSHSHMPIHVVMLPGGKVFASGSMLAMASQASSGPSMASLSYDGDHWTRPYRFSAESFVWDRGNRLVCVKVKDDRLMVSFCDLDKLGGRPEENPTSLRILKPVAAVPADADAFARHKMYPDFAYDGRIFCSLYYRNETGFGEIDSRTGKAIMFFPSGMGSPTLTSQNCCDSDGRYLWVATQLSGLYQIGLTDRQVKRYTTKDGLASDNVRTVRCHEGKVYIGTLSGLNILDPSTGRIETITKEDGMPDNSIAAIAFQDHTMWLGTVGNGAIKFDTRTGQWSHFPYDHDKIGKGGPDLLSDFIPVIIVNGDSVYFTSYGIAEYNTRTKKWAHYMRGPYCSAAVRDGDLIWYASWSDGIFTFNMKTKEVRKHFVRTPSHTTRHGSSNFSRRLVLAGAEVVLQHRDYPLVAVSKNELLNNSFVYEQWKKVHVSVPRDENEKD